MGLNYQDVAGVSNALGDLSQTLLKRRMMEQNQQQFDAQNALSQQRIGVEQQELDERRQERASERAATADYRQQMLQSQQFKQGVAALNQQVEDIQNRVDAGSLSEEDGSAALKNLHEKVTEAHKLILDNSLLSNYASGGFKVKKGEGKQFAQHPTATIQDLNYAQQLEEQADAAREAGDDETAEKLANDAALIRQRLQKSKPPGPYDTTTTITEPPDRPGQPPKITTKETKHTKAGEVGAGAVAADNAIPTIKTQAEFDKLPSGTIYIGTGGKKFKKP